MSKKYKKWLGVMLAICMLAINLPTMQVNAASNAQIKASVTAAPAKIMEDGTVNVKIELESTPYEGRVDFNDVILVLDCSGSMNTNQNLSKLKAATKEFTQNLDLTNAHRIGVVSYGSGVKSLPLTTEKEDIMKYIENASDGGSTRTDLAIEKAIELLGSKRSNTVGSIVLMTDGGVDDSYRNAAIAAAEKAKGKKYVFYTVALCENNNTQGNIDLKSMATSEADHYSVFSVDKLNRAYNSIRGKIGKVYPKEVEVTQVIPDPFEYVSGSANTVPQPTVIGNTIKWKMNQLGQGTIELSYKLKVKDDVTAGEYIPCSGTVTYRDYNNGINTLSLHSNSVKIDVHAPVIKSVSPSSCKNGDNKQITLDVKYLNSKAKLFINGVDISKDTTANVTINNDKIVFNMPDQVPGDAIIKVVNPDGQSGTGVIKIEGKSEITKIEPAVIPPKAKSEITISGIDILTGQDTDKTVQVIIGTKAARYVKVDVDTQTIVCTTPALVAGPYDVKVINKSGQTITKTNGIKYEITPPPITPVAVTQVTPTTGPAKAKNEFSIIGTGFKTGVKVKLVNATSGYDKEIKTEFVSETELKCITPSLKENKYDIIITNTDGGTATVTNGYEAKKMVDNRKPVIESITPSTVQAKAKSQIEIKVSNLVGDEKSIQVIIGTKAARYIKINGDTITCTVPALSSGSYEVKVINSNGLYDSKPSGITYIN